MTSLPNPANQLIGREVETLDVINLLSNPETRLLTITGPGGVGKTRLAIQVGQRVAVQFPGGVDFVRLDAIRDPMLILPALAQAVGVRESPESDLRAEIVNALRGRRRLLILDNLEQISAGPSFGAFMTAANDDLDALSGLKLLVTSRTPLAVYGEREYPLAPLPLPNQVTPDDFHQLLESPSIRLFVDRATEVNPAFALNAQNADAVLAICRRLDGLPLAIELAAARTKILSPAALLARLSNQLQLLTGGPRNRPTRQQTMRDAIAWSHQLLTLEEQLLFRRLGAFVGGFTLDAAEAVCGSPASADSQIDWTQWKVLDGVSGLVDESLVHRVNAGDDQPRFAMFQMIEEFARERLVASGEVDAIRRAHSEYVAALTAEAKIGMVGPEQSRWFALLDVESDNVRAALDWASAAVEADLSQCIAGDMWRYWSARGRTSEGRRLVDRALALDQVSRPTVTRAWALLAASLLAEDQADYGPALAYIEEAERIARDMNDPAVLGQVLNTRANIAQDQGRYDEAVSIHRKAHRLFTDLDDHRGIAGSLHNLGTVSFYRGELDAADDLWSRSLEIVRATGDQNGVGLILGNLGNIARTQGDLERAVATLTESLTVLRSLGDEFGVGNVMVNLGDTLRAAGDHAGATVMLNDAVSTFERAGSARGIAITEMHRALLDLDQADYGPAAERVLRAISTIWSTGDKRLTSECLESLGEVAYRLRQLELAAKLLGAAAKLRETLGVESYGEEITRRADLRDAVHKSLAEERFAEATMSGAAAEIADLINEAKRLPDLAASATPPLNEASRQAGLGPREVEIVKLIAGGQSYQQIAERLDIAVPQVASLVALIYGKLNVDSRAGITAFAFKNVLI